MWLWLALWQKRTFLREHCGSVFKNLFDSKKSAISIGIRVFTVEYLQLITAPNPPTKKRRIIISSQILDFWDVVGLCILKSRSHSTVSTFSFFQRHRPSGNFHLTTPREARGATDDDIPLLLAHRSRLTSKPTGRPTSRRNPTSLQSRLGNIARGKHMCHHVFKPFDPTNSLQTEQGQTWSGNRTTSSMHHGNAKPVYPVLAFCQVACEQ